MKKQTIGHQRLAKLATFLYRVPRAQFDMEQWASRGFDAAQPSCGTTACAIGWAASCFQHEGFRLARGCAEVPIPYYRDKGHWAAVTAFFGVSRRAAYGLFGLPPAENKRGPRQVAKNIKHFLKTGKVITT